MVSPDIYGHAVFSARLPGAHDERNGPPVPAKVFLKVSLHTAIEMATHFLSPFVHRRRETAQPRR